MVLSKNPKDWGFLSSEILAEKSLNRRAPILVFYFFLFFLFTSAKAGFFPGARPPGMDSRARALEPSGMGLGPFSLGGP